MTPGWADLALGAHGLGPGRRIALLVDPDPRGAALLLAAGRSGALVSPLNTRWTLVEQKGALEILRPHMVVVGEGVDPPEVPEGTELLDATALERRRTKGERAAAPEGGAPTWVLWTSGSTGRPRGIVLEHNAVLASIEAAALRLGLASDDRWIASLSPAHVGGLVLLLRAAHLGCGLLAPGRFDAEAFGALVDCEAVTHASLVPTQLLRVLEARRDRPFPSSFRALLLGGAAAPPNLVERALAARVPLALTWGMTETSSQAATAPPPLVRAKPGTVGPPLDGVEVERDAATGELRVRGPVLASGEYRGPGLPLRPLAGPDGWYRTGDAGRFDEEGHLWIRGRLDDRIVTGGVTVEPAEIEAVLLEHPAVREAAVVGVPDPEWGERIVAVVVPTDPEAAPTPEALREHLVPALASAKLPRRLRITATMPRTATGKIDRAELRRRCATPHEGAGDRSA